MGHLPSILNRLACAVQRRQRPSVGILTPRRALAQGLFETVLDKTLLVQVFDAGAAAEHRRAVRLSEAVHGTQNAIGALFAPFEINRCDFERFGADLAGDGLIFVNRAQRAQVGA